jgi:hypothetical protein
MDLTLAEASLWRAVPAAAASPSVHAAAASQLPENCGQAWSESSAAEQQCRAQGQDNSAHVEVLVLCAAGGAASEPQAALWGKWRRGKAPGSETPPGSEDGSCVVELSLRLGQLVVAYAPGFLTSVLRFVAARSDATHSDAGVGSAAPLVAPAGPEISLASPHAAAESEVEGKVLGALERAGAHALGMKFVVEEAPPRADSWQRWQSGGLTVALSVACMQLVVLSSDASLAEAVLVSVGKVSAYLGTIKPRIGGSIGDSLTARLFQPENGLPQEAQQGLRVSISGLQFGATDAWRAMEPAAASAPAPRMSTSVEVQAVACALGNDRVPGA